MEFAIFRDIICFHSCLACSYLSINIIGSTVTMLHCTAGAVLDWPAGNLHFYKQAAVSPAAHLAKDRVRPHVLHCTALHCTALHGMEPRHQLFTCTSHIWEEKGRRQDYRLESAHFSLHTVHTY